MAHPHLPPGAAPADRPAGPAADPPGACDELLAADARCDEWTILSDDTLCGRETSREPVFPYYSALGFGSGKQVVPLPLDLGQPDERSRRWKACTRLVQGLLIFTIGAATGAWCSSHTGAEMELEGRISGVGAEFLGPRAGELQGTQIQTERKEKRYAFVTMAYDAPGAFPKYLYQVLPLARALQRLSKYPLVLLTNNTQLPDGTSVLEGLNRLNVQVLPLYEVPLPEVADKYINPDWRIPYWKLQIWRLTQFDKLIWLDTDSIMFRSMDWLFRRRPAWGQKDNWACTSGFAENWLCSGLMLIKPSEARFHGLRAYAARGLDKWWTNGDQKLIRNYYANVLKRPVQLLNTSEASFGKCIGHTPSLNFEPQKSRGPWNIPAFVHKSSANNECFNYHVTKQLAQIDGALVNVCHYHPLGPYWRDLFCDATRTAGAKNTDTEAFCDDTHWYSARW